MNAPSKRKVRALQGDTVSLLPDTPRRWLRRQAAHGPLYDPVVQGVFLVMGAALFASAGWALRSNHALLVGNVFIAAAVGCCVGFLLLSGRAMERDKVVEYWRDRRALRLQLRASRAKAQLLAGVVLWLRAGKVHDEERDSMPALTAFVDDMHAVVATEHEDAAVLLVLESDGWYTILHAAVPPGSRFVALRTGVRCSASERPLAETLKRHARYERMFPAEVDGGVLRIIALSMTDFNEADDALLEQVQSCLDLLAPAMRMPEPVSDGRRLRRVV
jgi:hypothetical protein